jgi:hypothetical protein
VDVERREWLRRVANACERMLAHPEDAPIDAAYVALLNDVAALLARVRAELQE